MTPILELRDATRHASSAAVQQAARGCLVGISDSNEAVVELVRPDSVDIVSFGFELVALAGRAPRCDGIAFIVNVSNSDGARSALRTRETLQRLHKLRSDRDRVVRRRATMSRRRSLSPS